MVDKGMSMARGATKKKPSNPAPSKEMASFAHATVLPSEVATSRYTYSAHDAAMVQRCISDSLSIAVSKNAMVCADQRIRLFRKASGSGSKLWPGRKLSRKSARFFMGDGRITPGRKALEYANDAGEIEEVVDHPAISILHNPNIHNTGTDWMQVLFWFRESLGKNYLYKGERDTAGWPTSLYHLYPQWVRVQADQATFIRGYWYGRNRAQELFYESGDVIYGKYLSSPDHPLYTWSWPQAMQLPGDMENAALQSEIARWNNGGNPGMVIEVDENTTREQALQIAADINAQVRGVQKSGMPLILRMAKANKIGVKPIEMNYKDGLQSVRDHIFLAAGWVESMWKMGSAALASAEMADPTYLGQTINPRICKLAEELTEFLLPEFGIEPGEMWFAFDNPVAEDREALVKEATLLLEGGVINQPEAREMLEIEDSAAKPDEKFRYHGVDVDASNRAGPQQTASLQALVLSVRSGDIDASVAKAIAKASMPQIPQEELNAIFDGLEARPATESVTTGNGDAGGGNPPKAGDNGDGGDVATKPASPSDGTKAAKKVSTKDAELPNQPKKVESELADFEARVNDWYARAMSEGVTVEGVVNIDRFMPELERIMYVAIPRIMQASGEDEAGGVRGSFSLAANLDAVSWARTNAARMVTQVSDSLRSTLNSRVVDGISQDMTIAQIRDGIKEEAPDFSANRAEMIARTETSFASNEGSRLAARENGATHKKWLVAGGPCPVCESIAEANPDPVPIDDAFTDTEVLAPPAHPNCRCTIINVYPETE